MSNGKNAGIGDLLTLGFGTTTAMWALGFFCRMPSGPIGPDLETAPAGMASSVVPSELLFALLLLCLLGGGFLAGRLTARGWRGGACAGLISSLLNLLILMGVVAKQVSTDGATFWAFPGFILACMALTALGAAIGSRFRPPEIAERNWNFAFAAVALATTLLLLLVGGLVTSFKAGLAVPDWPNTFGTMMFFYPLSKMSGGIYFEHSHRLLGTLVGLSVLTLAIYTAARDERKWLRWLLLAAVVLVIAQGVLGGLRVTGHPTLSGARKDVAPSTALAVVHGVTAQIFFALLVSIALLLSDAWRKAKPVFVLPMQADRGLHAVLTVLLAVQLVLGALVRHTRHSHSTMLHVSLAAVVLVLALSAGVRAWGRALHPAVARAGKWMMALAGAQTLLGMIALFALGFVLERRPSALIQVAVTCAHQTFGALVLSSAVVLLLTARKFLVVRAE